MYPSKVIELSCTLFAQFGIPEVVVTDNSACFVSEVFETYLTKNGVKHITSAPYHPSTNGLAERAMQIVKKGFKKDMEGSMSSRISRVLMAYRTTPQSTIGVTPSELLQGRWNPHLIGLDEAECEQTSRVSSVSVEASS